MCSYGYVVYVKTITGQTYEVYVDGELTIQGMKDKIMYETNYHSDAQRLIFAGRCLEDERKVSDYHIVR